MIWRDLWKVLVFKCIDKACKPLDKTPHFWLGWRGTGIVASHNPKLQLGLFPHVASMSSGSVGITDRAQMDLKQLQRTSCNLTDQLAVDASLDFLVLFLV